MQILLICIRMAAQLSTSSFWVNVLWIISTICMAIAVSSDPSSSSTTPGLVTVISDTISLKNLFNVSFPVLHSSQRINRLSRKKPIILPT